MNKYEKEIRNRFGENMLNMMKQDFPSGFHIIGGDETEVIIGNKDMNISYDRKKFKAKEKFSF
jgi:thymidylate synthase ThyX